VAFLWLDTFDIQFVCGASTLIFHIKNEREKKNRRMRTDLKGTRMRHNKKKLFYFIKTANDDKLRSA